jgi:tetratricopeptide (TPR) repeat protein
MPNLKSSRITNILAAFAIIAATILAYSSVERCGYIWDDDDYVSENLTIRDVDGLVRIWLDTKSNPQYYPLVHSSFWIEYQLWGLDPLGYHVVNVAIHTINALLLWIILRRLAVPGAWFAALIFAIHPVHVESVAWITERKNVLSGLFYLSATYCFLRFANLSSSTSRASNSESLTDESSGATGSLQEAVDGESKASINHNPARGSIGFYIAALLLFICALLSKTVTATFPAAMLVIAFWKRDKLPWRDLPWLSPFFAIGIGFGLLTVQLEKSQVGASGFEWDFSMLDRILIAGRVVWFYFGKLVWPHPLIFTYHRWTIDDQAIWQYAFPAAALAVILLLWFLRHRIGKGPVVAVLLFVGTLFPALGFFDVYPMRFSFVADHFQYLASVAMIALLVATFATLANRATWLRYAAYGASVAIVGLFMFLTWRQVLVYENLEVLWRDTLAKNPTSWMAHNNLGSLLARRGDYREAETHLRQALEYKPDYYDAHANMGKVLDGLGRLPEAEKAYLRAVELRQDFPTAFNGLAVVYAKQGKMDEAKQYLARALLLDPGYAEAHTNLGKVLQSENQIDAAIREYEEAVRINPNLFVAQYNLALTYYGQGNLEGAAQHMAAAVQLQPSNPAVRVNLGAIYLSAKKHDSAIASFQEAIKMAPDYADAYYNLGVALNAVGDQAQANANFEKAESLRRTQSMFAPKR